MVVQVSVFFYLPESMFLGGKLWQAKSCATVTHLSLFKYQLICTKFKIRIVQVIFDKLCLRPKCQWRPKFHDILLDWVIFFSAANPNDSNIVQLGHSFPHVDINWTTSNLTCAMKNTWIHDGCVRIKGIAWKLISLCTSIRIKGKE